MTGSLTSLIRLTARELPRFGFRAPKLALAGLNPHAGEHGLMGREEETILTCASTTSMDAPMTRTAKLLVRIAAQ